MALHYTKIRLRLFVRAALLYVWVVKTAHKRSVVRKGWDSTVFYNEKCEKGAIFETISKRKVLHLSNGTDETRYKTLAQ